MKEIVVIGSGFSGLASAACLAKEGYNVTVIEKNASLGGRCRKFEVKGFTFDAGPSWYWMPEVFENFFQHFGKTTKDFYDLKRLDPSYDVVFSEQETWSIPAKYDELVQLFESFEPGSGIQLDAFLKDAAYKYKVGMEEFVWKPSHSILEFADMRVLQSMFKLQMLSSISKQIDGYFKDERIRNILKFPVLFLGATPEKTPALYSLMNYADIKLGTWYPIGGMSKIIDAFVSIGHEFGVKYITECNALKINVKNGCAYSVTTSIGEIFCDCVISGADYHHTDQKLLERKFQNYTPSYWDKRVMAPSSLLFYLGLNTKIEGIAHHTLFFDRDFALHAHEIYTAPKWPSEPLFYVCCPSVTDASVAPDGCENLFILMPLAPDIEDNETLREKYFNIICDRLTQIKKIDIRQHIVYKSSFCTNNFVSEYNSFKGNAYGLANTLMQTAFLKPKLKSKKVQNLYYTGQLTTPGPGMPPSIISGQVVAKEIIKSNQLK